jgi:hypothetical protein
MIFCQNHHELKIDKIILYYDASHVSEVHNYIVKFHSKDA